MNQITGDMLLAILPEIGILILAALILILDVTLRGQRRRSLGWITALGTVLIAVAAALWSRPGIEPALLLGGAVRLDGLGFVFRMIFLVGAGLTALVASTNDWLAERGEFYALLLISTFGMSLMASSADLITLYLAIETTSIPLYLLAGFVFTDKKSVEAGIKYLLFGAMTSAVMLYGFSLLYGFSGTTSLYEIAGAMKSGSVPAVAMGLALMLVLVGFSFKISAFPFHFWAPDVYEGAPTPVAGFLSTASKAAGFAVALRFITVVFPDIAPFWTLLAALIATGTMLIGNLVALTQTNIKRLLAYSSIAQAGYVLIGVAANSAMGTSGAVYYLMGYLVTNLAAFAIVAVVSRAVGSDDIAAFGGLSRRSPKLALAMLIALLSLGGVPPFAGFFGKLLLFGAAIQSGMVWLAIVGIVNSLVALYYYLNVIKVIYLYRTEGDTQPVPLRFSWGAVLSICVLGIVVLGTLFAPFYNLSLLAASALIK